MSIPYRSRASVYDEEKNKMNSYFGNYFSRQISAGRDLFSSFTPNKINIKKDLISIGPAPIENIHITETSQYKKQDV
jgi:hypothetical protein